MDEEKTRQPDNKRSAVKRALEDSSAAGRLGEPVSSRRQGKRPLVKRAALENSAGTPSRSERKLSSPGADAEKAPAKETRAEKAPPREKKRRLDKKPAAPPAGPPEPKEKAPLAESALKADKKADKPRKLKPPKDDSPAVNALPEDGEATPPGGGKKPWLWILLVVIIAAAALLVYFGLPLFTAPVKEPQATPEPSATVAPTPQPTPLDENALAALTGYDPALYSAAGELNTEGVRIGVSTLNTSVRHTALIEGLQTAGATELASGALDGFFSYDARGSENQQVQDVYNMVNDGASVIVLIEPTAANFARISEIAAGSGVPLVVYNAPGEGTYAVNVKNVSDPSAAYGSIFSELGFESCNTVAATPEQIASVEQFLEVRRSYGNMWDAVYQINASIEEGNPLRSMLVFDLNANDILRAWLRNDTVPRAVAGKATVTFIKTWYQLINGGVSVELPTDDEDEEPDTISVSAGETEFDGYAATEIANVGEVLFTFAYNLAHDGVLPEENFLYEISGYDIINNDNLAEYYEQVKDLDAGMIFSSIVDTSYINTLFAMPADAQPYAYTTSVQQPAGDAEQQTGDAAQAADGTPAEQTAETDADAGEQAAQPTPNITNDENSNAEDETLEEQQDGGQQ